MDRTQSAVAVVVVIVSLSVNLSLNLSLNQNLGWAVGSGQWAELYLMDVDIDASVRSGGYRFQRNIKSQNRKNRHRKIKRN